MAHTPGPWQAAVDRPIYDDTRFDTDTVYSENPLEKVCKMTGDAARSYDDARLISAAPDLLAALKHAADGLDLAQAQVDSERDAYTLRRHLVAAKRAIAKAEGKVE